MMIDTFEYRSWHDLRISLMRDLFYGGNFVRSRFLFRGQADADWPLISAYDRWFNDLNVKEEHRISLAGKLHETFKQELCDGGHHELCKLPEAVILSLGQHHGLPTRLLDWSNSPYVAAIFAFMHLPLVSARNSKIALWALDTKCYHWSLERGAEIIKIDNPGHNMRLRNQEGRFTLLRTTHKSLESYVESFAADGSCPLKRFLVPADEAMVALSELASMGITPSRVYPDLQGIAIAAKLHCHLGLLS